MKEYKRLTIKNEENGLWGIDGKLVNQNQKPLDVFEEAFYIAVTRLAEIEDKIENGTLIELPCKVGDTVYVFNRKYEICEMEVISFMLTNKFKEFYAVVDNPYEHYGYTLYARKLNKDWFLTKSEAEQRLKELRSND